MTCGPEAAAVRLEETVTPVPYRTAALVLCQG